MEAMMEQVIRQFLSSNAEGAVGGEDEEQLIDLLESLLEEEMAQVDQEGEVQRAQDQEQVVYSVLLCFWPWLFFSLSPYQMFEHSQALHAHNQQQNQYNHPPSSSGPSSLQEASHQHGPVSLNRQSSGPPITQDQLASALASALGSSSSSSPRLNASPLTSLNHSQLRSR